MARTIDRIFAAVSLVLTSALTPQIAEARHVWPARGAGGDQGASPECDEGRVVVGFNGRAGEWIDAVQLICARPLADGGYEDPQIDSRIYGGTGGGPRSRVCNQGTRILDARIFLTGDAKKVENIEFHCVDNAGGNVNSHGFGHNYAFSVNPMPIVHQGCSGESVTGLNLRFGQHVNAVGLICDQVAIAAPPAAPAPVAAPAPPPGPPVKAIKHTGRAGSATPTNYDLGSAPWLITPTVGAPFKLILNEDKDTATVTGQMIFERARNNGTLTGSTTGGGLYHFTYEQPGAGISGSGMMKVFSDGRILAGDVKTNENPPREITWKGTVAPMAPRAAFNGLWDVTTDRDEHFRLQVILSGQPDGQPFPIPIAVNGILSNVGGSEGEEGSLQGVLQPGQRQFNFNYAQKSGANGSGVIALSYDGNAMEGSATDSEGAVSVWKAQRVTGQ